MQQLPNDTRHNADEDATSGCAQAFISVATASLLQGPIVADGLPPLEEQKKLFSLLAIEERLGITLTAGFQMVPEHSTIGIYIHHPRAEYLS